MACDHNTCNMLRQYWLQMILPAVLCPQICWQFGQLCGWLRFDPEIPYHAGSFRRRTLLQISCLCFSPNILTGKGELHHGGCAIKKGPRATHHPLKRSSASGGIFRGRCANCRNLRRRQNTHHTSFALGMFIVDFVGVVRGFLQGLISVPQASNCNFWGW